MEPEELPQGKKRAREEDDIRPSPPKRCRSLSMTAVHDRIYEQPLTLPSLQCIQEPQFQDSHEGERSKGRIQVAPSTSTAMCGQVSLADDIEHGSGVDVESLFRAHIFDPLTATFVREIEELCSIEEELDSSLSFSGYSSSSSGYSSSASAHSSDETLFSPTKTTELSCKASIQKKKSCANSLNPRTPHSNHKTRRYGKTKRRTAREARFSPVGSTNMVVTPDSNPLSPSSSLATVSSESCTASSSRAIQKNERPGSWLDTSVRHLRTARLWIDRLMWMIKVVTVVDDVRDRLVRRRDLGHAAST